MKWPKSVEWKNHISFGIWTLPKKVISIFYKCSWQSQEKKQGKKKMGIFLVRKTGNNFCYPAKLVVDSIGGSKLCTVVNFKWKIWGKSIVLQDIWHRIRINFKYWTLYTGLRSALGIDRSIQEFFFWYLLQNLVLKFDQKSYIELNTLWIVHKGLVLHYTAKMENGGGWNNR